MAFAQHTMKTNGQEQSARWFNLQMDPLTHCASRPGPGSSLDILQDLNGVMDYVDCWTMKAG